MKPNENNFCGGNFQDWLEVMLYDKCNGKCSWCVEKDGYRPNHFLPIDKLIEKIIETKKQNVILLGGEPTLHPGIGRIIKTLTRSDINVYVTTNGSLLSPKFVTENLTSLKGINISIHDFILKENYKITGIDLDLCKLQSSISLLHLTDTTVRLNCNLIRNHIDSYRNIIAYTNFAKDIKADGVRFAELKNDKENWVNMMDIFDGEFGVNNEPFGLGCVRDVTINDIPVNLRQMCGLQTHMRKTPCNPEQINKQVMYYDGNIYDGWQKKETVSSKEVKKIVSRLKNEKPIPVSQGCQY